MLTRTITLHIRFLAAVQSVGWSPLSPGCALHRTEWEINSTTVANLATAVSLHRGSALVKPLWSTMGLVQCVCVSVLF